VTGPFILMNCGGNRNFFYLRITMQFKKLSLSNILFLVVYSSLAQGGTLDSSPVSTAYEARIFGSSTLGSTQRIPYERITGSPFWKPDFQMATIIDVNNQVVGKSFSKLNLYSNELYFITPKGELRVAAPGKVRKVVFYKGKDTTSEVVAVFETNPSFITEKNPNEDAYVQVLNNGEIQLLKHNQIVLMSGDSLMGTYKRYYFLEQVNYYLINKAGKNTHFRKLSKSNILETLSVEDSLKAWIKQNSINFKKEEDVIRFLNYYNTRKTG